MAEHAWALPKGSVRSILALIFTTAICYIWVTVGQAPTEFFTLVVGIWAFYFGQKALATLVSPKTSVKKEEPHPLWLPKNTIRSILALEVTLVACYLWVTKGKVDPQVLKGAGIIVSFYFLQNAAKAVHERIKAK
ncbi:hypothetical protein DRP43_02185 [candidate division TA06 bacterium]|uniref:Uncharacterized protein n=1 Tax=candidate division TA06 bacterium TaxID=2250710 RepID=A0A660SLW7_UNCT6|nr:MAG: hypothetical protein DRP43_02185 [candidate division TA06 bacterium]